MPLRRCLAKKSGELYEEQNMPKLLEGANNVSFLYTTKRICKKQPFYCMRANGSIRTQKRIMIHDTLIMRFKSHVWWKTYAKLFKVRKRAKIRNRYNQAPHLNSVISGIAVTFDPNCFEKFFQEYHLSVKKFGNISGPTFGRVVLDCIDS